MPVAEGVVYLRDDGLGRAIRSTANPEAHGLESKTGEPRQTAEPDLTLAGINAMLTQLLFCPIEHWRAITVVSILHIDEGTAIQAKAQPAFPL